jgi:hypothetical protein
MCLGLNSQYVTKTLVQRGYLKVGTDGKSQVRHRLPGMGQIKVQLHQQKPKPTTNRYEDRQEVYMEQTTTWK